jgi:hypothetical protein
VASVASVASVKSVDSVSDPLFDPTARYSAPDGLDHFRGIVALLVTATIGLDLYFWLGLNRPPQLAILWVPPIAINMWRRVVTGDGSSRWQVSWYRAMGVYSLMILAVAVIKRPRISDDWWLTGFAVLWAAMSFWKSRP